MRKPRIKIERSGYESRPWWFVVKWPGNHWKNSRWFTFEEALIAAGVKKA
jgi:hypothetical protein